MAFANLGFEDEDAAVLGFPDIWTVAFVTAASSSAGYDDESDAAAGADPIEDFAGGWSTNAIYTFAYADPPDLTEISGAIYDGTLPGPESVEDYEEGWTLNQNYIFVLGSAAPSQYSGFVYLFGTTTGPYDLTGGGQTLSLTTEAGTAVSDAVTAAAALASGSGASYAFATGEGPRRIAFTVDGLGSFSVELDAAGTTQNEIRDAINLAAQAAISFDVAVNNAAELDFFGQLVGNAGGVRVVNQDGGRRVAAGGPHALINGDTLTVAVDGGGNQTVTFLTADFVAIGAATDAELAAVIARDVAGATSSVLDPGAGDRVVIETENLETGNGDSSSIEVIGGSITPAIFTLGLTRSPVQKLGHFAGDHPGAGNVGDESAVLLEELVAIVSGTVALIAIFAAADIQPNPTLLVVRVSSTTPTTGTIEADASSLATVLGLTTGASVGPTGFAAELEDDFESDWDSNQDYFFDLDDVIAGPGIETASFDVGTPEAVEDFEEEWDSNESYDFTMGAVIAALYDGGIPAFEDFEEVLLEAPITVVVATNTVVRTAHGLSNGERVSFRNEDGALPSGLNTGFLYFVITATANDYQVAATSGGSAVVISDNGVGTHFMIGDQTLFWTSDLGAL